MRNKDFLSDDDDDKNKDSDKILLNKDNYCKDIHNTNDHNNNDTTYIYIYFADPGKSMGCSTNTSVIYSFIQSVTLFLSTALRRRQAQTVKDGDFSHKLDYLTQV